jgi:hypothetical protein
MKITAKKALKSTNPLEMMGELSNEAAGVFLKLLLFSEDCRTDGRVDERVMFSINQSEEIVNELLDAEYLTIAADDDAFMIVDWADMIMSNAKRDRLKAESHQRMIASRNRIKARQLAEVVVVPATEEELYVALATVEPEVIVVADVVAHATEETVYEVEVADAVAPDVAHATEDEDDEEWPDEDDDDSDPVAPEPVEVHEDDNVLSFEELVKDTGLDAPAEKPAPVDAKPDLLAEYFEGRTSTRIGVERLTREDFWKLFKRLDKTFPVIERIPGTSLEFAYALDTYDALDILKAAKQFDEYSADWDDSDIPTLKDWLAKEDFLHEDVFAGEKQLQKK